MGIALLNWNYFTVHRKCGSNPATCDTQTIVVPTVSFASYRFGTMGITSGRRHERVTNPSRYGECLRIFRTHTQTGMSSQTVYALRGKIQNLPDTISRHGENSKEEAIWAA
jgi:hypothetical protein